MEKSERNELVYRSELQLWPLDEHDRSMSSADVQGRGPQPLLGLRWCAYNIYIYIHIYMHMHIDMGLGAGEL